MISRIFLIKNKYGLHARPAGMIVDITSHAQSEVQIRYRDARANAKSILNVMMLAATPGSEIEFLIDGPDEQLVSQQLETLFENRFYEDG